MMNRNLLLTILLSVSLLCYSQVRKHIQNVTREGEKVFLNEDNGRFEVDKNVVTVKFINLNDTLKGKFKVLYIDRFGYIDLQVPENEDVVNYVEELKQTELFESIEYNGYCKPCVTINDPWMSNQQSYLSKINIFDAWEFTMGNPNIKVAVIDTGIDITHEDLGNGSDGYSNVSYTLGADYSGTYSNDHIYPTDGHGTAVAGIIGAKTNNNKGIAGITGGNNAQGVTLIPYSVSNSGFARLAIYDAIDAGAQIINISQKHSYSYALNAALDYAFDQGVCVVCASGNDSLNYLAYPASHETTIAVGACLNDDSRKGDSQYGTGLDLVAPGGIITSTKLGGGYEAVSGTSAATPFVTGAIALMLSIDPSLTPTTIRNILHETCTKFSGYNYNTSGWNEEIGYGLLDVHAAVINVIPCSIQGPSVVEGNASYFLSGLPPGYYIIWSIDNNQVNMTASGYNCSVSYNQANSSAHATLRVTIKKNGKILRIIEKQIQVYNGFSGTYNNGHGEQTINYPNPIWVTPGTNVTINSTNLVGATVTYTGNASPTYNLFYSNIGQLQIGIPSANFATIIVNIACTNGHTYLVPLIATSNPPQMSVSAANGQLTVSLVPDESRDATSMTEETAMDIDSWTLEVYNAVTGEKKCGVNVHDGSYSISTAGWKTGIYSVRATINEVSLYEKIVIK